MRLFSKESVTFRNVRLDFPVKVEDFIMEKKGRFCLPEAGDVLDTVGVVSVKHEDGTVDILFRNKLNSKKK